MTPDEARKWLWAVGGSRFILCVLIGAASLALCLMGKLTGGEFVMLTLGTIGAYITGNVVQNGQDKKTEALMATVVAKTTKEGDE